MTKRPPHYKLLDTALNIWSMVNRGSIEGSSKIVISGDARSGTTWLAQILSVVPGYPVIWEPFHRHTAPTAAECGIQWHEYIRPDERGRKTDYVDEVVNCGNISTEIISRALFKPASYLRFRGLIIKMINGGGITPYLEKKENVRIIVLVRHPCAVVSSKLRKGNWQHLRTEGEAPYPGYLMDKYPEIVDIFNSVRSIEERLAIDWAVSYMVPFNELGSSTLFTSYEWLLRYSGEEVERIFSKINFDERYVEPALKSLGVPSATTESDSALIRGGDQLQQWKKDLSSSQIDRIFSVIERTRVGGLYERNEFFPDLERS